MEVKKTDKRKSAETMMAALELCSEQMQENCWAMIYTAIKSFVDPSISAVYISAHKGDVNVMPINMELEDVQDLIMWLGDQIKEDRAADISAAASALKN